MRTRWRHNWAEQLDEQGDAWSAGSLVFASAVGTEPDAANIRRAFRQVIKHTNLNPDEWTPRELRHSFVSLLSDNETPLEEISTAPVPPHCPAGPCNGDEKSSER